MPAWVLDQLGAIVTIAVCAMSALLVVTLGWKLPEEPRRKWGVIAAMIGGIALLFGCTQFYSELLQAEAAEQERQKEANEERRHRELADLLRANTPQGGAIHPPVPIPLEPAVPGQGPTFPEIQPAAAQPVEPASPHVETPSDNPKIIQLEKAIREAFAKSQWDVVIAKSNQILAIEPKNVRALLNLGGALSNSGRFREGEAVFRNVLVENEKHIGARMDLSRTLHMLQESGNVRVKLIDETLALNPADNTVRSELHYLRGSALEADGKLQDAVKEFTRAIELDPRMLSAYHGIMRLAFRFGHGKIAEDTLLRYLAVVPSDAVERANLAQLYNNTGRYSQAISTAERVIDAGVPPIEEFKAKNIPDVYIIKGWAYYDLAEYELAAADFSLAVRRDPLNPAPLEARARSYLPLGKYQHAIADCDRAIQLDPASAEAYECKGMAHFFLRQDKQAKAALSEALQLNPQLHHPLSFRAVLFIEEGKLTRAREDLNAAIRIAPTCKWAYQFRGFLNQFEGRHEEAKKDFVAEREHTPGLN